jgi:CRP/FNR family transcriptional regulator, polysaccharide utilization system transcription regulator
MKRTEANCCGGQCASLKHSLLSELEGEQRCAIKNYVLTLSLKKGQAIFEQGKESQGFFCIKSGKVKVSLETYNDDSVTVDVLADKGMIGYTSLISESNFYSATCLTDATVCYIPKVAVKGYLGAFPGVEVHIKSEIGKEYARLVSLVTTLRSKTVQQRTAETLIRLGGIFGEDSNNCIDFEITKEEISKLIGSSIESVFRTLSVFKEKGLIENVDKKIKICNWQKLRVVAKLYD